ncbi:MAG: sugar ABC transporter permease [Candidatus Caldatribacterium sp.]|nr:sugar ABC transporter permease [Candidatus Caldatribacterium sp.]
MFELRRGRYFRYVILAPAMSVIFFFALFPLFYTLRLSFTNQVLTNPNPPLFVGLAGYRRALNDPMFWSSLGRTAFFTLGAVSLEMILGTLIAFLLSQPLAGKGLIRTLMLLPVAVAPIAMGLVWRYMYHADFGIFNFLVERIGLARRNWLGEPSIAMFAIILFDVWQWTPFVAFVLSAALHALPREPFEAAQVDGAPKWLVFKSLIVPMIAPVWFFVFLLRVIDAVRLYDPIYALTRGGPGTATETLSWYLYRNAFAYWDMGYSAVIALLFLYAMMILSSLVIRVMNRIAGREG